MTPNKEDYLKAIYDIGERMDKITNKEIAQQMAVSPPAVTEMTKRMISEGWIQKDSKRGYLITDQGQALVTDLYRKHRLIETFLIQSLHYSLDQIHEEAEILEHTVSTHFIDRLESLLDYPKHCPHGGSIPAKGQPLIEDYKNRLSEISQPGPYQLVRVDDRMEILHYLERQDLPIGSRFTLIDKDDFSQIHTISYQGRELTLPESIAQALYVAESN